MLRRLFFVFALLLSTATLTVSAQQPQSTGDTPGFASHQPTGEGRHDRNLAASDRQLDWIYPPDERVRVSPAFTDIVSLESTWDDGEGYGDCTGSFIGPRVVLTAAHCLYDIDAEIWADDIAVIPGMDGLEEPLGYVWANSYFVPTGYIDSLPGTWGNIWFDYGLIIINEDLGNQAGMLSLSVLSDTALGSPALSIFSVGYPADKLYGTQWITGDAKIESFDDYVIFHRLDGWLGQSGSPVMRLSDDAVIGIQSSMIRQDGEEFDVARRVTHEVISFANGVCAEESCSFNWVDETAPSSGDGGTNFYRTWERTDRPVDDGQVSRTWMWGPEPFTDVGYEDYAEAPGGQRQVQYFDKSRMEITNPNGDPNSIWYVTNGLLVVEMTSGRMQVGNNQFIDRYAADINVAGDGNDLDSPTYETIGWNIEDGHTLSNGQLIVGVIDWLGYDPGMTFIMQDILGAYGVTAGPYSPETGKHTASVFWEFMNSNALVYQNGGLVVAPLFENPYYATGLPIDQPWWAEVRVAGTYKWVLIQCFERRCLTYTPDNPPGWQVEAGNVGQHYYSWRYE